MTLTLGINMPLGDIPGMPSPYAQNVSQFHAVFFGFFRKNNVITSLEGLAPPSMQIPDATPDDVHFILKSVQKPECIPLGCAPSAAVVICWQGVSTRRCLPRGCLPRVIFQGGCLPGECLPRGCLPGGVYPSIH